MKCLYILLTAVCFIKPGGAEVFTALVDLEKLLQTNAQLIPVLDGFINTQERKIHQLKQWLQELEDTHSEAAKDADRYISNPINAYLIVKRLHNWKEIQGLLNEESGKELVESVAQRDDLLFPEEDDLKGAVDALARLQDTYLLDIASLARGEIQGVKYTSQMTAGDCFELGKQSYHKGDHYHTVLWMQEALNRYRDEINKTVSNSDILEYLAFSTFMQGNVQRAITLTNELLQIVPSHPRAQGNIAYYEVSMEKLKTQQKRGDDGDVPFDNSFIEKLKPVRDDQLPERRLYEQLCRGEKLMNPRIEAQLKCHYVTNKNPYFLIGPLRQEEVSLKPRIVLYHNVLFDSEIETIKYLATPMLRRATVQNYKSGELEHASYRISKSAWLKDNNEVIRRVNNRIQVVTGLSVETAEELQVANYGIGGHYEPHFDFARKEETKAFKSLGTGNRIATFLFYMSDVDAGGATVFTHAGVTLWPKKGSAAFWYNLHSNGEGDVLTRHAACPVLAGIKWVSNKWIHEHGQEFIRPCDLTPDNSNDHRGIS